MIFDIVEFIILEWTMPNESRICKICRRGAYPKKKKVLLASLPQSSTGQKLIARLKNQTGKITGRYFFSSVNVCQDLKISRLRFEI